MRILFLGTWATIILDILAWMMLHLGIGYFTSRIDVERFKPEKWIYQTFRWEKGGEIYDRIFHVRSWKKLIPNGSGLYASGYSIKHLRTKQLPELERWLKESCRAEFCHWMMIWPGFLFFMWNGVEAGWAMVVYAVANNLVPIVMQRYNRPRARKLISVLQKRVNLEEKVYVPQEEISLNPCR